MSHLTEKLAEFVFEELPEPEMAEAKRHLTECASCREQVERFQQTFLKLKVAPDVELPRNIVFDFERPAKSRVWRWFPAAAAIAALLLITIALAGRVHIQWHDSQLTIAFGEITAPSTDQDALEVEIQRLQGHVAYLESRQQVFERDAILTASTIELLARGQRPSSGD
jgi:predicted anti-sigma-YlaC factor YlaD